MQNSNYQLDKFYRVIGNIPGDLAVVFDIGTKATRILVASTQVPQTEEDWYKPDVFFNSSITPQLGDEFLYTGVLDIKNSRALRKVVEFINFYLDELKYIKTKKYTVHAVGTAVFRWMQNKEDVVKYIREKTGITVNIILKKDEAFLSLISVAHTYRFKRKDNLADSITSKDIILLIDQGGGSTEISYFLPKALSIGNVDSIDALGTVVLQDKFLSLVRGKKIDPAKNTNTPNDQFKTVLGYIDDKINNWKNFDHLISDGYIIHAYGMGSAIGSNNFKDHNKLLTIEDLKNTSGKTLRSIEDKYQAVKFIYEDIEKENQDEKLGIRRNRKLKDELPAVYGLPVYEKILNKFKVDHIRFAGFALRYGVYIAIHKLQLALENLPDQQMMNENSSYKEQVSVEQLIDSEKRVITILEKELSHTETSLDVFQKLRLQIKKHEESIRNLEKKLNALSPDSVAETSSEDMLPSNVGKPKKVFISYAHEEEEEHRNWVVELSAFLRTKCNIDSDIDAYNNYGTDLKLYMETKIEEADKVILICSPNYGKKSAGRKGGVGYEVVQILNNLFRHYSENSKFIPVLRKGTVEESIPVAMWSLHFIDMTDDTKLEQNYNELVKAINNKPPLEKPALGKE